MDDGALRLDIEVSLTKCHLSVFHQINHAERGTPAHSGYAVNQSSTAAIFVGSDSVGDQVKISVQRGVRVVVHADLEVVHARQIAVGLLCRGIDYAGDVFLADLVRFQDPGTTEEEILLDFADLPELAHPTHSITEEDKS